MMVRRLTFESIIPQIGNSVHNYYVRLLSTVADSFFAVALCVVVGGCTESQRTARHYPLCDSCQIALTAKLTLGLEPDSVELDDSPSIATDSRGNFLVARTRD